MKMNMKIGNKDIAIDGTPDEIWHLLSKLHIHFSTEKVDIKPEGISFPTTIDIIKFIESKPDFLHTMGDVQQHFLNRLLDMKNPSDKKIYTKLNRMIKQARKQLAKAHLGEWIEDPLQTMTIGKSHFTAYKFIIKLG